MTLYLFDIGLFNSMLLAGKEDYGERFEEAARGKKSIQ